MHLSSLPPELAILILRCITDEDTSNLMEWRRRLPLLHICKRLRILALPLVCSHLCLKISNKDDLFNVPANYLSFNQQEEARIESNISIIERHKRSCCVKSIKISIYFCANPFSALELTLKTLACCAPALMAVKNLELGIFAGPLAHSLRDRNSVLLAVNLAQRFAQLVPGVNNISTERVTSDSVYMDFAEELTKQYAHQLVKIKSRPELLCSTTCFSPRLAWLHIDCYLRNGVQVPYIHSETLIRLDLIAVSSGFDWSSFATTRDTAEISFKALKYLNYGTSFSLQMNSNETELWRSSDNNFRWKLSMPALKVLHTFATSGTCALLAATTFPECLQMFCMATMDTAVLELTNSNLNMTSIKHVFAKYAVLSDGSDLNNNAGERNDGISVDLLNFTNEVLSIPNLAEDSYLRIGYYTELLFDIDRIQWSYLSRLSISKATSFSNILKLIDQLPSLVDLAALNVVEVANVVLTDSSTADSNQTKGSKKSKMQPAVKQFQSKLKRIYLANEQVKWSKKISICTIHFLTARIKTLDIVIC